MIKKIPLPIAGLILALLATGNLLSLHGSLYRSIFGIIGSILLILLITKIVLIPKALIEDFENPVIASVMPTFSMALILLSSYIRPFSYSTAFSIWIFGLILHGVLIILFTIKHVLKFNIKKVFPSYFIVYVGIVAASVTAPLYNMSKLGQYIFWFGFAAYLILLPIVIYRTLKIKEIPEPALPTITIFAAPASLCLTGYISSFESKNIYMIGFLGVLSSIMFICVLSYLPKMLKIKFYPSYSAFTFPIVITSMAFKVTYSYLTSKDYPFDLLKYCIPVMETFTVAIVFYVLIRYCTFMFKSKLPRTYPIHS